jgi:four helix bundle protein
MQTVSTTFHPFDLEKRTLLFARAVRDFCKTIPKTTTNHPYIDQILRSSSSVGANYNIEANESLSKKDFCMRTKICRKEVKETRFWLELTEPNQGSISSAIQLKEECTQLLKILKNI